MFCKSCGYQLPKNDLKFCPQCGTPVNLPQQEDPEATKTLFADRTNQSPSAPETLTYNGPDIPAAPRPPMPAVEATETGERKKKNGKLIGILIAVFALLAAALIFFALKTNLFGTGSKDPTTAAEVQSTLPEIVEDTVAEAPEPEATEAAAEEMFEEETAVEEASEEAEWVEEETIAE